MKKAVVIQIILAIFLLCSATQTAYGFYKWVDDQGTLHVTDYPPPAKYAPEPEPEPVPVQKEIPAPLPPPVPQAAPSAAPPPPPVAAPPQAPMVRPAPGPPPITPASKPAPTAPQPGPPATVPQTAPATTVLPAPGTPIPISPAPSPQAPSLPKELIPAAELVGALMGGFMLASIVAIVCLYVFYSLCLYKIAKKLNVEGAWAAWVPIVNAFWPVVGAGGKPGWWIILLFVPVVNIFINIYLWMCISENCGKSKWLGLLLLVPLGPLFLWGYLGFSKAP